MDEYLSIRCIKMLALHTPVFLYKSFDGEGFSILSEEFKALEHNLSYVYLTDVTFVICDARKKSVYDTGARTAHAFAYGTLQAALPRNVNVKKEVLRLMETLPEVDYMPYNMKTLEKDNGFFFYKSNHEPITEAKELYAFNRKVKVQI